jgi:hypothetical protein
MGSIDKALPLAGFYPDSQNRCSDGAKIKTFSISSKYFGTFLKKNTKKIGFYPKMMYICNDISHWGLTAYKS